MFIHRPVSVCIKPGAKSTVSGRFRFVGARIARQGVDISPRVRLYETGCGIISANNRRCLFRIGGRPMVAPTVSGNVPCSRTLAACPFIRNTVRNHIGETPGCLFVIGGRPQGIAPTVPGNVYIYRERCPETHDL